MFCWKCQAQFEFPVLSKISFRAICENCGAWLHVCKQCCHYAPGKPNQCNVPGTDYIADREMANYCEEFSPSLHKKESAASKDVIAKQLFGEDVEPQDHLFNKPDRFGSLFKEEDDL